MRVLQLVGPYAGEIVDMPFAIARDCVAAGSAAWLDGEISKPAKIAEIQPRPEPVRRRRRKGGQA